MEVPGVHAQVDHVDARGRRVGEAHEIVGGLHRVGDDTVGPAHGPREDGPVEQTSPPVVQLGVHREGEVVDGHHAAVAAPERPGCEPVHPMKEHRAPTAHRLETAPGIEPELPDLGAEPSGTQPVHMVEQDLGARQAPRRECLAGGREHPGEAGGMEGPDQPVHVAFDPGAPARQAANVDRHDRHRPVGRGHERAGAVSPRPVRVVAGGKPATSSVSWTSRMASASPRQSTA